MDGRPAAHFEHTVAVAENGPEILTLPAAKTMAALETGASVDRG